MRRLTGLLGTLVVALVTALVTALVAVPAALPGSAAAAARPDLRVRDGSVALVGGTLTVGLTVVNASPRAVRRPQVALLVDGAAVARLTAGRSRRGSAAPVSTTLTLPAPGSHTVTACADPDDRVREQREGNNCHTLGTVVVPRPAAPTVPTVPSTPVVPPPAAPTMPLAYQPGVPVTVGSGAERSWVVVPSGYDPGHGTPAPTLVFLHGCFDTATNQLAQVRRAATFQQTVLVVPELGRDGACWDLDADPARLRTALADLRTRLALDPARITLAGYSSGALLAGRTALAEPASYAGLRVVNGSPFLTAIERTTLLSGLGPARFPVRWRSHDADPLFPRATVAADQQALRDAGFAATATETSGGHEVSTADLTWLLAGVD